MILQRTLAIGSLAFLALGSLASAAVEKYEIDPVHSSLGFTVRHFVAKMPGSFSDVKGVITIDRDNLEKSSVEAEVSIKSVNTANEKRDAHLKNADFFDEPKYPVATFKSTKWEKDGDEWKITGDLTLHGVTKSVVLETEFLGFGDGPGGAKLVGFEAETELKRSDFGMNGGGPAIGDDVDVKINIEARLKK